MKKFVNFLSIKAVPGLLGLLLLTVSFTSCYSGNSTPKTRTSFAFDTVIVMTYYDEKDEEAINAAISLLSDYEEIFSRTKEGAEVYSINETLVENSKENPLSSVSVCISEDLYKAISLSIAFSDQCDGAFDITLGALLSMYNFSGDTHEVPSEEVRNELLSHTGMDKLTVTESDGKYILTVEDPCLQLDFGGMAKGYIADRLKEFLVENGVKSAILNLGGNVLVIGNKPDGTPFSAGIQRPEKGSEEIMKTVSLSDNSLVTSGTYQRYFEQDGITYHHLINPETGLPEENGLLSVSVICPDSCTADMLSTALFILGEDKGKALLIAFPDVDAYFIDSSFQVR